MDGSIKSQKIPCRYVPNPNRLSQVLKDRFLEGTYKVEMRHNVYQIYAPGELSLVSIPAWRLTY